MRKLLSNKKVIMLFIMPGLLVYMIMFVIPIATTFSLSLTEWDMIGGPKFIGLNNYIQMITKDTVFIVGIKNVFKLLFAVLLIQLPIALLLSLLLSHTTKGIRFYKTTYFIPVVFSATAVGLVWLRIFDHSYGIINLIFKLIGLDYQQMWLSDPKTVIPAICIPLIWSKMGYYLIIFYAGIKGIPKYYYEAALLDGCTGIHATFKITLPLLHNIINMCVVLGAIGALREYPLIYVMTLGGPFNSSMTPAIEMYLRSFVDIKFGYGSSLATSLVILSLVVSWVLNKIIPIKNIQY